jgi:hypothetical protein
MYQCLKGRGWEVVDRIRIAQDWAQWLTCEDGNEPLHSTNVREFIEKLSYWQLLKDSVPSS